MFPFILSLTAQEVEERLNSISNKLDKDVIRQSLANPSSTTVPSTQAMADVLGPLSEGIEGLGSLAGKDSVALDTSEVTGVLPISKGGTGASSLEQAQQNLGILSEEDITTLIESVIPEIGDVQLDSAQTSGVLPISKGGSGAQTTQQARINLGVWSASQSETVRDSVNESLRRSYAEAGYNVVGTFREGFTIANANDVGIDERTGKAFSGPAGDVAAGTNPVGDANWTTVTDQLLRSDLASVNGAGLVGTKSGTTIEKVLASDTTLPDVGIFEAAGDNSAAITALASNSNLVMPVHGELRTINSASFSGIEHLVATKVLSAGVVRIPGIYPELLGGKYSVAYNGGKQLSALNTALNDPKFQDFGVTFVGDSITWGVGATGAITTGPARDGTLSDYRNNAGSCTFVNEIRRWIKRNLGAGTTEVISNHPYSVGAGGESISTFSKGEYLFPKGVEYSFTKTGSTSDKTFENVSGPYLNCRRVITVGLGGTGSLVFNMTGTSFTLVFGGQPAGAMYELLVNGVSKGTFSARTGDDGIISANNQRRKHTFDYVRNGNITIKVIQYGAETTNN